MEIKKFLSGNDGSSITGGFNRNQKIGLWDNSNPITEITFTSANDLIKSDSKFTVLVVE